MRIEEVSQEMVEAKKQELRQKGIAEFKIAIEGETLTEDQSIAQTIAESWSFFYVCVRSPYSRNSKKGNLQFRIFQTNKEKPSIPMGYYGMPAFAFECYTGNPRKKAISLLKEKLKNKYSFHLAHQDEIHLRRIETKEEQQAKEKTKQEEKEKYTIKETDTPEIKEVKGKIAKLQEMIEKGKLINKYIKQGKSLSSLGISAELEYKLLNPQWGQKGIPQYEFTSWNGKLKRLKSKIKGACVMDKKN